jgi:hypothetical protein
MQNYGVVAEGAKRRELGNSPYWYLFLIGRDPGYTAKGNPAAPRLILPFIQKAKEAGVSVWLEATSPHSRDVYKKLGFKVVEELKIGRGSCDSEGNIVDGGPGVSMWAMCIHHGR